MRQNTEQDRRRYRALARAGIQGLLMKAQGLLIMGAAALMAANADAAQTELPSAVEARKETVTATVEAVDHDRRMIALKAPAGDTVKMEVGPEVAHFHEIEQGDRVNVDYLESVAVAIAPPGASLEQAAQSVEIRNEQDASVTKGVETEMVAATVEKIDAGDRTLTLKAPDGSTRHMSVAPDVPGLEKLRQGDQVIVAATRELALNIESE